MSKDGNDIVEIDYSDVSLTDASNPSSILNFVPPYFAEAIMSVPESFHVMDERELKEHGDCRALENRLRTAFWFEYDRALLAKTRMNMVNVYTGVCSVQQFRRVYNHPSKLAYILRVPTNYKIALHEILAAGIEQARDILLTPHIDDKGKFDAALANQKLKIIDMIFNRTLGGVVQKNVNMNVDATPKEDDSKDTQEKIRELESKILQHQGRLIDVKARESEEGTEGS